MDRKAGFSGVGHEFGQRALLMAPLDQGRACQYEGKGASAVAA